jgi:hypothetical protein
MITGQKPNGYFSTFDEHGMKIEGETRQCVHCQHTWEYRPGSGITRGWCMSCHGFVCAREECLKQQFDLCAQYQCETGKTRSCIPFELWNDHLRSKMKVAV